MQELQINYQLKLQKFKSKIEIIFHDQTVDCKNMMDILLLSIGIHDSFTIKISGTDEKKH